MCSPMANFTPPLSHQVTVLMMGSSLVRTCTIH